MDHARIARLVATTLLAALTQACGGAASSLYFSGPGDDGGVSEDGGVLPDGAPAPAPDAAGTDAGPPWSPVCPNALPATGTSCLGENLQCEYGNASWSVSCDAVVQCQNGQWWSYQPSFEACTPKPGPNSASCPATYASVPLGASCAATGVSCVYGEGLCSCQEPLGGPIQIDSGTGPHGYWGCVPEQGCPFPRPRLGSACASAGLYCTYEACSYAQTCQGGVWQGQSEACAVPGGGVE